MSIKNRSNESKRIHADSLIKIGNTIHTAVIAGLFVSPILFLAKQLFDPKSNGSYNYLSLLKDQADSLFVILLLFSVSTVVGITFKNAGFNIIDGLEKAKT